MTDTTSSLKYSVTCPACHGAGYSGNLLCHVCGGSGRAEVSLGGVLDNLNPPTASLLPPQINWLPSASSVVRFALTDEAKAAGLPFPERKHPLDAGFDLRAFKVTQDGDLSLIQTGVMVAIPPGYCGLIRERSSWARFGLRIHGGVVDSGFIGEVAVMCYGYTDALTQIESSFKYPRFAQLLIVPIWQGGVENVDSLDETERGVGGFGSTGQG